MNWTQLSVILGVVSVLAGGLWKAASAWTKKAIAIGEKAEAERAKEREVAELRRSHEKFMGRVGELEKDIAGVAGKLELLTVRLDERERERARRDTLGIVKRSDGE